MQLFYDPAVLLQANPELLVAHHEVVAAYGDLAHPAQLFRLKGFGNEVGRARQHHDLRLIEGGVGGHDDHRLLRRLDQYGVQHLHP